MVMALCGSGSLHCHGLDLACENHDNGHTSEKRNKQDTENAMNTRNHNDDDHLRARFNQEYRYYSCQ
jgi:hypothetical protein